MVRKKNVEITPENVRDLSRLKKVEDIEYRVVCGKDVITGQEEIHIAPSKGILHNDIMNEMIRRNPRVRDMAGRVLLYDTKEGPIVYFSAEDDWGMMTTYWDWDPRVIPYLEPKIKKTFLEMKAEGKTATLHIDHSKDKDYEYWGKIFDRADEIDVKFAGRGLMKKVQDYAPQSIQEEDIKVRTLRELARDKRLEQGEEVRAQQDAKVSRVKRFLWKQAGRDGD